MILRKSLFISCLCCVAVLCLAPSRAAMAQTVSPQDRAPEHREQTLQALLDEVRRLRMAIQRISVSAYRAQIAVERLRVQQGLVDGLSRDLEAVRSEIDQLELNQPLMEELIEDMEKRERAGLVEESERKRFELEVERQMRQLQRLREREAQLRAQLEDERAALSDIKYRLDVLERELEAPPSDDQPDRDERRP